MKDHGRKSSLFKRYAILFFAAMFVLAGGITFTLFHFSSEKFVAYEQKRIEDAAAQAAQDLETQYLAFQDVAHHIRASSMYRPGVLRSDPYRDIELLDDFVRFTNYSPIIYHYFLMYQDSDKIYTSDGKTSYFIYYSRSVLGMDDETADGFYAMLHEFGQEQILAVNQQNYLIFPVRFTNTDNAQENAVMVFCVSQQDFASRVHAVSDLLDDILALEINGTYVLGNPPELSDKASPRAERFITTVTGIHQIVSCHIDTAIDRWPLLLASVPSWMYFSILLILLLLSALSLLLARVSVLPLRRLLNRHQSSDSFYNEFIQLDEMVSKMEEENQNSSRLLRNRTLLTILRGYYSERLVEHWGFLHLVFDQPRYCVAILDDREASPETIEKAEDALATSAPGARIYLCHSAAEGIVAVIFGFDSDSVRQKLINTVEETLSCRLTIGHDVDAPERISTSYMDALTIFHQTKGQQPVDAHLFIMRLVAAAEDGDAQSVQEACRKVSEESAPFSAQMVKRFMMEVSHELESVASAKHVTIDRSQLTNLGLLSNLETALSDLASIVIQAFHRETSPAERRMNAQSGEIIQYVQEHAYDPDFDLGSVGTHFSLNNDYVSSMINSATGTPFKEYLTLLRMERACELLREHPEMTVTEISQQVGYRKVSNFIKKFKDIHGIT
ncbi:MAG: helix-turn-helix domain-containing protein, partial [Clostridia bacterium]|nr:helix-turn-helix domain-containing protein [Clostridia bacterium]